MPKTLKSLCVASVVLIAGNSVLIEASTKAHAEIYSTSCDTANDSHYEMTFDTNSRKLTYHLWAASDKELKEHPGSLDKKPTVLVVDKIEISDAFYIVSGVISHQKGSLFVMKFINSKISDDFRRDYNESMTTYGGEKGETHELCDRGS